MTTKTDLVTLEGSGLIQIASVQPELEYLFRHALVQDAAYSSSRIAAPCTSSRRSRSSGFIRTGVGSSRP